MHVIEPSFQVHIRQALERVPMRSASALTLCNSAMSLINQRQNVYFTFNLYVIFYVTNMSTSLIIQKTRHLCWGVLGLRWEQPLNATPGELFSLEDPCRSTSN